MRSHNCVYLEGLIANYQVFVLCNPSVNTQLDTQYLDYAALVLGDFAARFAFSAPDQHHSVWWLEFVCEGMM